MFYVNKSKYFNTNRAFFNVDVMSKTHGTNNNTVGYQVET